MRRPFVFGRRILVIVRRNRDTIAQQFHLTPQTNQILRQLEHRLVLLRNMMLEMRNFFLEMLDRVIHLDEPDEVDFAASRRSLFNSGTTTRA